MQGKSVITRKITKIKIHEDFFMKANHSPRMDIALIKLDSPVDFTHSVNRACLPSGEESSTKFCFAIGLGMTNWDAKEYPRSLMEAHMPKIPDSACRLKYGNEFVNSSMFCAGVLDGTRHCTLFQLKLQQLLNINVWNQI